ncbi:MAG: DNA polymerase III subunit delta [Clostridia bacterium]|nr:DNA polymerase III subunit delta [Clostridia bacterium]
MTEKEFRAEIRSGKLRNAYFFCGAEEYLKRIARRTLRDHIIEDESFASFNLTSISAEVSDPAQLTEPLSSFPFMAEKKLVEYYGADLSLFSGNKLESLMQILSNDSLFESSVLCIIGAPDGFEFQKKAQEIKFNSIIEKELAPYLTTVYFTPPTPGDLIKWVARHIEHSGAACSPDVARALINRAGRNMDKLALESDKLACYALSKGKSSADIEDLDAITIADPELSAFALSNAVLTGRPVDAFIALDAAKKDREKPTEILAGIISTYADMLVVKELAATGISDREINSKTGIPEYRAKISRGPAASASREMLERSLSLCIECDGLLKSGGSSYIPVERLLCELTMLRRQDR